MTESNKATLIQFGKVAALGLLGIIAIITSAGIWNGVHGGVIGSFYGWIAGLNLIAEGFGIWSLWKFLFKKSESVKPVEEEKPVKKTRKKKTDITID